MSPVSRLFTEVGQSVDRMNQSLRTAITTAQAAGPEFAKISAAGQNLIARFQDSINPTQKFKEQIELLTAAGFKQADVWKVMGDQLTQAADQTRKMGQVVDPAVQKMLDFGKAGEKAGFSFESFGKNIQDFAAAPLKTMQSGLVSVLEGLGPVAVGIGGVAAAAVAAGVAIFKFVESQSKAWEALNNLSLMTGLTIPRLQALQQIVKEAGLEGLDLGRVLSRINEQLGKPEGATFERALAGLKIFPKEGDDAIDILDQLGKALQAIPSEQERVQMGLAILGVRYRELLPLILQAKDGFKKMIEDMERSGPIWDEMTRKHLEQFDHGLDLIIRTLESVNFGFMEGLGKVFSDQVSQATLVLYGFLEALKLLGAKIPTAAPTPGIGPGQTIYPTTRAEIERNLAAFDAMQKAAKEAVEAQKKLNEELQNSFNAMVSAMPVQLSEMLHDIQSDMEVLAVPFETVAKNAGEAKQNIEAMSNAIKNELIPNAFAVDWINKTFAPKPETGPEDSWVVAQMKKAGEEGEKAGAAIRKLRQEVRQAIDTTFSDMERGIAEAIVHWKSFGETVKSIFQDLGVSFIRILEQRLFKPMEDWFGKIIDVILGKGGGAGGVGGFGGFGGSPLAVGLGSIGIGAAAGPSIFPGPTWSKILAGASLGTIGGVAAIGAIGGAAGGIGAGAGAWGSLAGLFTNPWTAIPIITAIALPFVVNALQGKNAWQAGAPEAMRDFAVSLTQNQLKQFAGNLGLSEAQTYGIRKELLSSPLAITQLLAPLAQANGQMDTFLKKLENVTTSWGTFNLRTAYEAGVASGDFAELNKVWAETIGQSTKLAEIMPDFAEQLAAVSSEIKNLNPILQAQIDGFTELQNAIQGAIIPADTMYSTFLKTGVATAVLADKVAELGGSVEAFSRYGDLVKTLAPLQQQLGFIEQLQQSLASLVPELDPIKALLSGTINQSVLDALAGANLEPGKFTALAGMIQTQSGWGQALDLFKKSGALSAPLKEALATYGGTAGQTALERYAAGFNTITENLLATTKAAMDKAYENAVKDALTYLGQKQKETVDQIESLQKTISDAAADVIAEIKLILAKLNKSLTPATTTTAGGGGGETVPGENIPEIAGHQETGQGLTISVYVNGSVFASNIKEIVTGSLTEAIGQGYRISRKAIAS